MVLFLVWFRRGLPSLSVRVPTQPKNPPPPSVAPRPPVPPPPPTSRGQAYRNSIVVGEDRHVSVWSLCKGQGPRLTRASFCEHQRPIRRLELMGRWIVTCSGDYVIRLWDFKTGGCIREIGVSMCALSAWACTVLGRIVSFDVDMPQVVSIYLARVCNPNAWGSGSSGTVYLCVHHCILICMRMSICDNKLTVWDIVPLRSMSCYG